MFIAPKVDGVTDDGLNGDGRDDLAIGIPEEGLNGVVKCGAVAVIYGK